MPEDLEQKKKQKEKRQIKVNSKEKWEEKQNLEHFPLELRTHTMCNLCEIDNNKLVYAYLVHFQHLSKLAAFVETFNIIGILKIEHLMSVNQYFHR